MDKYILDEQIDRFINDDMLPEEREDFCRKLNDDQGLKETVLIRKLLVEAQLRKSETEFREKQHASSTPGKKHLKLWAAIVAAAVIALLLMIGNTFSHQPEELYYKFYSEPIVEHSRGNTGLPIEQILLSNKIDSLYKATNYTEVVALYKNAEQEQPGVTYFTEVSTLHIGLSLMKLNQTTEATVLLKQLLSTEYAEEAEWLLLHVYLKENLRKEACVIAKRITEEKGRYSVAAEEILNNLNKRIWFGE